MANTGETLMCECQIPCKVSTIRERASSDRVLLLSNAINKESIARPTHISVCETENVSVIDPKHKSVGFQEGMIESQLVYRTTCER